MPADPAKMMLGDRDNAQQLALINKTYYFDQPIHKQYAYYLQDLSPISFHYEAPSYTDYIQILNFNNCILVLKKPVDLVTKGLYYLLLNGMQEYIFGLLETLIILLKE